MANEAFSIFRPSLSHACVWVKELGTRDRLYVSITALGPLFYAQRFKQKNVAVHTFSGDDREESIDSSQDLDSYAAIFYSTLYQRDYK